MGQFPTNLDPALEFNGWYVFEFGVGETLVKFTDTMQIEPLLADSWNRLDDLTWKFHIRQGVKFQDGVDLTAEAVKSSIERSLKLNPRTAEILPIASMTANGQDLTLTTKTPYEELLGNLADPLAIIVDTTAKTDTFAQAPIGTGPFKVQSYSENKQVVVEKNEDYWGGKALIDVATFKYIKDNNTRSMALQNGEIDVANNISSSNISLYEGNSNYNVDKIPSLRIIMAYENLSNEFLKDPAVRKAIALGVDRETYAQTLLKGTAVAAVGPFPASLPFGAKKLTGYSYDKAAAVKLLADAGYADTDKDGILEKNGQKLELRLAVYTTRAELPVLGEAIQSQLKDIGISIKLETYESVATVLKNKNFDLCLYNVNTATTGDPQSFLTLYFKTGGSANYGGYSNQEVDALLKKLGSEHNTQVRYDLATQAQQIILNDNADLFLVTPSLNLISKKTVSGLKMYPVEYYLLNNRVNLE
ncbi:ABC transporter substrate-binding protein [Desulfosporosinus sp. PR]|uniref:ABC transporter substrate-binding protein n=1 Tax=Candidatus Desulfosporosinus nitrosoreducens TaxID=3401928 RepID=UPI0027F02347|nr:ABC transporter substrate-binding protein [Desulfosporosinus sp. PR]MDQ7093796.1 ABC transporter substrate-binding protein [Desulfosporosinus sp. PR]